MSWRACVRSVAAVLVCAAFIGCDCPQIRQQVYVAGPDSSLQPLIDACRTAAPSTDPRCQSAFGNSQATIPCACRPLCFRVLEIIDQFSGGETLLECDLHSVRDAGSGDGGGDGGSTSTPAEPVRITVTYRPSTCD